MSATVRVELVFSRGPEAADMSHQQALRAWEVALSASGLPLALTEGRTARPRFSLVAPLPRGYTSEGDRVELFLGQQPEAGAVAARLNECMPQGIRVLACRPLPAAGPSLQSQLRWAEYRITVGEVGAEIEGRIDAFFAQASIPWEETIEGKTKHFDLRELVDDLWVEESEGGTALGMRLNASSNGTGRPDSVVEGLKLTPRARHRTRLLFAHLPQAIQLWRRFGRFQEPGRER